MNNLILNKINIIPQVKSAKSQNNTKTTDFTAKLPSNFVSVYSDNEKSSQISNSFKAFAKMQNALGYKEIETFKMPYIGEGKIFQLNNGHKVIILPKPDSPVFVTTAVKVGAYNETNKEKGISHLIEHLLYKDNLNLMKDLDHNAFTSDLLTNYYFKLPLTESDNFENCFKMHSQGIIKPDFSIDRLEKEKKIISSEIETTSNRNDPNIIQLETSIKNLIGINDLEYEIAGTVKSVNELTPQQIKD